MIPPRFAFPLLAVSAASILIFGCETKSPPQPAAMNIIPRPRVHPVSTNSPAPSPNSPSPSPTTLSASRNARSTSTNALSGFTNGLSYPYISELVATIKNRWYTLLTLDPQKKGGKVILNFRLFADGRVSNAEISSSTVDEKTASTCQKALLDSAPFNPWPAEMRKASTNGYRDVSFTFYFNLDD